MLGPMPIRAAAASKAVCFAHAPTVPARMAAAKYATIMASTGMAV